MAIVGHLTVGHQKAFRELREEVQCSCHGWSLTSTNIIRLCSGREILKPLGGSSMCLGMKTAVVNQFLPNRRHLINELESANLFSQFVKDGSELMVASKDESIRFFQQCLPGDRYSMKNVVHVPFVSLDIYDVAMNPMGDALCYATWSVSIFYARYHVI
ncbi:hypothetical protein KIN20_002409 [Parelaphostrongylus tenuis]|uniref:Uncharacterized protein n=1 Tax=Parelaphostrongylus tenuis TaxID=148309 RepID=A0AAD5ME67_PARTN|nr:hypothetical protein KIN20_002409 [Parelaphostrongylus tenuis]